MFRAHGSKLVWLEEKICVWKIKREKAGCKLALREVDHVPCIRHCAERFLYVMLYYYI